jgi:Galactose oxidase, central domain
LPDASEIPAVAICEDVLYVIGGANRQAQTAYNKVWRFNLKTLVWLPEIQGTLPYPILATYASACPVVNGRLIIGGGMTTVHGGFSITNIEAEIVRTDTVTAYDTHSNSFSQNPPLPEVFGDHLFLLVEDKLFAIGGRNDPLLSSEVPTSRMFIGTFAGMNSQPDGPANGSQPIRQE